MYACTCRGPHPFTCLLKTGNLFVSLILEMRRLKCYPAENLKSSSSSEKFWCSSLLSADDFMISAFSMTSVVVCLFWGDLGLRFVAMD